MSPTAAAKDARNLYLPCVLEFSPLFWWANGNIGNIISYFTRHAHIYFPDRQYRQREAGHLLF